MLARQWRGLSQIDLVGLLKGSIAQGTLSKIEHGRIQPSEKLVGNLASAVEVRPSFFFDGAYLREPMVSYHRKRQKLSATELQSIQGSAEIYRLNLQRCFEAVELEHVLPTVPGIDPDAYARNIEDIAATVRQRWSLPRGPVVDLTKTAEDAGIVVVSVDFGTPLIDGFCQHSCDGLPPLVFLNSAQPKDRWRFSLAHEIGHLVMHQTPHPEQETEANQFAAAFLMPAKEIIYDFFESSLQRFMDLKGYWGTSIQALVYRAWQLGKLTDRQYKYFVVELSKRGFRKTEPLEPTHLAEKPTTLRWVIEAHLNDLGYSPNELGEMFGLEERDLRRMYPIGPDRPKLKLIVSDR